MRYLDDWQDSVDERKDVEDVEKAVMTLSRETLCGLRITGTVQYACVTH